MELLLKDSSMRIGTHSQTLAVAGNRFSCANLAAVGAAADGVECGVAREEIYPGDLTGYLGATQYPNADRRRRHQICYKIQRLKKKNKKKEKKLTVGLEQWPYSAFRLSSTSAAPSVVSISPTGGSPETKSSNPSPGFSPESSVTGDIRSKTTLAKRNRAVETSSGQKYFKISTNLGAK
ncbi:oxidoreductase FAD-binding domain protein [Striga asiatica]|uniref:Oxidoreductase FAD-binding domain protein n=1 Tax=Striga asiatica TaxID=4170 RepID=A0A5A7QM51_STRAF|nr:oxidoreductase FAD-binding domain protein [Striga asiatica]